MIFRALIAFTGCLVSSAAWAAPSELDADAQIWTAFSTTGSVAGPVMLNGEVVVRASNDQGRINDVQFTGQMGYRLSKDVTVWIGYRRVIGNSRGSPKTFENRFRQQLNIRVGPLAGGTLASRTVFEQRWREGAPDMASRIRQQFRWAKPLRKASKTDFVLSHESFVHFNSTSWGVQSGYSRMRNFAGINTPIAENLRAELGYLNQFEIRRGQADRMGHVGFFALAYSF